MTILQVQTHGCGPDLLLLHGWAMHGGVFAPLIEVLADQFTVHAVDLPGHGYSRDCPLPLELAPVADTLAAQLPRAIVAGWSLGGLFALALAQRHPRQVRGLAMMAATPCFVQRADWPAGMPMSVFAQFGEELGRDWRGTIDRFLMLEAQGSAHLREELRFLRDAVYAHGQPHPRALAEGLALLEHTDLRKMLPTLSVPSRWLAGRRDRLVSPIAMEAAATLAGHAGVRVFPHAGHAPFLTEARAVADELTAFAADCAP